GSSPRGGARDTVVARGQLGGGGGRGPPAGAGGGGRGAARPRLDFVRSQVDASVVKAYVAALAADEAARVNRASADSLRRSADIAAARFTAGEISEAESEQVRIAAGRFAADTRTAEAAAVQARIALERLLGYPDPDGRITLTDDLPPPSSLRAAPALRATAPPPTPPAPAEAPGH